MSNQEGPLDYSGHQPSEDVDQYGRSTDQRINKDLPADFNGVRGYGLRADDLRNRENIALRVEVQQQPVKQGRDKAVYTRQQKGHSLTLWILFGGLLLWIPAIYYSVSPNHYWHA